MNIKMRILSFLVMLTMLITLLPLSTFAEELNKASTANNATSSTVSKLPTSAVKPLNDAVTTTGNVAKVGDTAYATIEDAIANWTNGTTLTLLANVTLSDVIKLKSTEYHILDLGTYTMTAAKNKDAIQFDIQGRTSAGYALDIKADATNPGGITATGGSIVRHTKPALNAPSKDRPITRFYGGVFNASYVVRQGGTFGAGYTGASAPYFYFYGGEFNGTIYTNRSMNQFYGGTFNGSIQMSVDSSAYTLVAGGRFKNLSNAMGSALNTDKFVIGSAKGVFDRSIYVDAEGYYVVTSEVISEVSAKYPAVVSVSYGTNDYFYYSAAATYGLFYEDAAMAIAKHGEANVTVYEKPTVVIPDDVTGDATVVEEIKNNVALKDYTPENVPAGAELVIELVSVGDKIVYDVAPMANGAEVEPTEAITFRLPVPASVSKIAAKVYHDGEFIGTYTIKGEGNAKYVEVSSADFSEYAVEPTDAFTVAYGTLEIGPANNLADVIECNEMLSSLLVWSDPTGQPVVTVNGDFVITENFIINSEYPVVFDLNGKTLTVAEGVTLSVGSNVQITGEGELVGNVKITNSESDVLNVGSNVNVDALTVVDSNGDEMIKDENGSFIPAPTYVAFVGTQGYETLAAAIAALQDGDTLVICAEEISEGSIKLPASLNNVTIKSENSSVLKNMTITAADGSSVNYNGLTIDGIVFDNSNLVFTGWRTGSVVYSNITISNCTFKNIVRSNNEAAIHFNCDATEAVENIVITKNVINGVSGGSNSGLYLQATGNVTVTDNVINNVAFRPYVIQITTDDGNADNFVVTGNTFSGSASGRAQGLGNNAEGTDSVNLVISDNIFKGITNAQQICYWNFNDSKTTTDFSGNYYDIDVIAKADRFYYNGAAADVSDLVDMGIFPIYTELNADGTINVDSKVEAPHIPTGSITPAFTGATSIWGEGGGNAVNSLVVKLYSNDTLLVTASLNNIGGIIDGDVYVSWNIPLNNAGNDEYWTVVWENYITASTQPTKVVMVIDGVEVAENNYQLNSPDDLNKIYAASADANGNLTKYYTSLNAALAAVTDDSQTTVVLRDVTENLSGAYLRGNIVGNATINLTNSDWVYCPYTFIIGEDITLNVPAMFYYAGGSVIRGTVVAGAYYQRYYGTKLTIEAPGSLTVTSETCIIRYVDGDPNAGIYIVGDNDDSTVELKLAVAYFYQGMISAKDATIVCGTYWQTNETDGQGTANLVLDNSTLTVTVYDHAAKATGNSTVTLKNGSKMNCQNGGVAFGENAVIKIDATSSITDKNGEDYIVAVAKIGNVKYETLQAAFDAVKDGETIVLLADVNELISVTTVGNITLNLNGKKIFGNGSDTISVTKAGTVLTIKDGTLESNGNNCGGVYVKNAKVILENCTLIGTNSTMSCAVYASNGATVIINNCELEAIHYALVMMSANVTINGGTFTASTSVSANGTDIYDDATLTINDGTFNGAIYWPANGKLTINDGTFTANTAIYLKSGSLEINGGSFTGNGEKQDYQYTLSGWKSTGAAIVIENVGGDEYDAIASVVINGGTFTSVNHVAIESVTAGKADVAAVTGFISGGKFTTNVADELIADGYTLQNGEVVVDPTQTVVGSGTWGGIDWTLYGDGTLVIAPTKGTPALDPNAPTKRVFEVGEWREAVVYKSNGSASAIGGYPYDVKAVKKLIIEEGVTYIGSFTAQFPNLTGEVVIPSTVTYIGQEAFHKTPITKLTFAEGGSDKLCIANGAFKKTLITELVLPGDRSEIHVHHWAFGGSTKLVTAYIPANVTKCWGGEHVDYFDNFNSQSNVSWTYISSIFTGCTAMQTITFENEAARDNFFGSNRNSTAEDPMVAYAGLTAYNTFAEAYEAMKNGDTLGLAKNVTITEGIVIPQGMTITLNLNGKTLSQSKACTESYEMILNKGNLTITGNGKISFNDTSAGDPNFNWGSYTVRNEGTLVVENGTIEHKGAQTFATHMICAIFQYSGSTTINGGTISTPNYRSVRLWMGDMTINGGTFDGQVWVQAANDSAALTINGGMFEPNGGDASSVFVTNSTYNVKLAVTDGTFNGKIGCSDATALAGAISGGKFNAAAVSGTNSALLAAGWLFGEVGEDGYATLVDDPTTHYINNVEDLKAFRDAVNAGNTFAGVTVYLTADIDLAGEEWAPIGTSSAPFKGVFDGQNNTVSNLVVNGGSASNKGFFGYTMDGEIKNLTINNAKVSGRLNIGVVAGTPYTSKFTNIKVTGHIEVNGLAYVGGVGGKNAYANWTNITVDVDASSYVKADSTENGNSYRTYVGGVIGFIGEGSHTFENISSNVKVIGNIADIGGMFGIAHYGNNFKNITFTGSVEAPADAIEVGGIAGVWHNEKGYTVTFTGVASNGSVTVGETTTTGSIVGGAYNVSNETSSTSGSLIIEGKEAWLKVVYVDIVGYTSFEAAAAAATAGQVIRLVDDVTLSAEVTLPAGVTLDGNGYQINGTIYAGGDLTIGGHTKITAFSASYYNRTITIGAGACLEITGTGRVTLGYGNIFNITGTITDAKTADKATVKPSLIIPGGISITGGNDATMNVTNAYVVIGSTTSKNSAANGTFTLNFTNSIAEFTNQLTFSEPTSGKNPTYNINIKDSVLTTGTKFVVAAPNSNVVVDNSVVTLGTYFRNSGNFTLQNGSVLTGMTIQFGENGGNNGTITVDASKLTIGCSGSTGHALDGKGTGKIVLKNGAFADVEYLVNSTAFIDETSILASKSANVEVSTATGYKVVYANGRYSAVQMVAKVGDEYYETVIEALQAAIASGASELVILCDVREKMTVDFDLVINADLTITAAYPVKVEFYNEGTSYDFAVGSTNSNTLTIGKNVHFDLTDRVIWLGYYGNNVDVVVDGYLGGYQIWHGADTTVSATGKLDSHGEAFIMRRNATLTVDGGVVNANYFHIYSGHIAAEDATITAGLVWIYNNHSYGSEGTVSFELNNTNFTSAGEVKVYAGEGKTAPITLANGSTFVAAGALTLGEGASVSADTSSNFTAQGKSIFVANVGGAQYTTLAAAIANANGETIYVTANTSEYFEELTNVTLATTVAGGVTVTNTNSDTWVSVTNLTLGNGVTLHMDNALFDDAGVNVIEGTLNIDTTLYNAYDSKTTVQNGGKLVVVGMIVNRYHYNTESGIFVYGDGDDSTVEVSCADTIGTYSGSFYAKEAVVEGNMFWIDYKKGTTEEADKYCVSNVVFENSTVKVASEFRLYKDASLTLTGSTVNAGKVQVRENAIPTVSVTNSTIYANTVENLTGASINAVLNADGTVSFIKFVAKIGNTYYATLADAFAVGGEVVLIADVDLSATAKIVAGKTVVLDLNGYTIDGTEKVRIAIMSYGNLTIKDSSAAQNGTIKAGIGTAGNAINICAGTFTLESGNIYSKNNVLLIDEQAAVINIKGGKLTAETATRNSAVMYVSSTSNTVINVTAGELVGYNGILIWNNTEVNVSGGTITATGSTGIQGNGSKDNTKITISGGEISGYWSAIYHPQGGELNISGGTLTGYTGVVVKGGKVTISGGTIKGTGAADAYRPVSSGYVDTGDALYVEHYDNSQNSENYGTPVVTVTGGTFVSAHGKAVASYANTNNSVEALASFISGGTFNTDVSDLCAEGYIAKQNADGTYGIKATSIQVSTWDELAAAIADADVTDIILNSDIIATGRIVVDRNLNIDLNGNTLSLTKTNNRVWKSATLTIDGDGQIDVSAVDGGNVFYVGGAETGAGTKGSLVLNNIEVFGENYNTGTNAAVFMLYGPASSTLDINNCQINLKNNRGNGSVFYDTGTNNQCKINIVDSSLVFDGTVRGSVCGDITIDNSDVVIKNCDNGFNEATLTIKNGSEVTITDNTGRGITVNRNGYGIVIENSTVVLANNGEGDIRYKASADIVITNSDLSLCNVVVDSGKNATINGATVASGAKVESVDGVVTISNPVAQIGEVYYATLEEAFKAATDGCTIEILADVTVDYYWDARNTGAKFTVPVTIDGNGHTIKFTNTVYDGGNYMSAFRFEADATVTDLTIDMSEAISGFAGRFRAISAKANLTVDGCTFIGNGSANNTRAIIFGEGATVKANISVTNSTFEGWRRAISDNEAGKDLAETIVITNNNFDDASVYVSAAASIKFNNNVVDGGDVDLRSYDKNNTVLSVEAQGNTLDSAAKNYIYAKDINAQSEFTTKKAPVKVSTKAELDAAIAAANDGDTIVLVADINYGTSQLQIHKGITLDLGGYTLTTANNYGGMSLKNNPTIKNGNIVHTGNTAAIKVWNAVAFEDLVIEVTYTAGKTKGGIVLQSGSTTRVDSIKNVTIKGAGLTNGIETYNCGDATQDVIGSMVNVTIEAVGTGMLISAPCGTATDCTISGGANAIEIWIKGNYSASLDLVDCEVTGGVYAHDEFSTNPDIVNNGELSFTVDANTNITVDDITLTIARAEEVVGIIKDVMDNAQAKLNNTYYATFVDAIAAAQDGDVITLLANVEISATTNISKSITIDGNGFALTQATGFVANGANVVFDIFGNATVTFKNLTFDAIKNVGVIRTVNANLVMDNCTIQNSEQTVSQGLLRLACGNATITNSKFLNNKCKMVVTFGYDAANDSDVLLIDGCTFEGNTCGEIAVVYFADGDYAKVTDTKFVDNSVSTTGNAATLYLGWGSGFEVSGCYFDGNSVTTTHATTKRFASAIFCDGCDVNGNVFGNNTAVRNGQTVSTVVAVGAYYGAANIDGNYWVDGSMPANGGVYTVEYTRNPVTLDNYYTDYSVNADGSVVLGGFEKMPAGSVAYRAYITDSTSREAIQIDLSNVYAKNSFVIKLYDANGNLLTTTTYRYGGVDAASFTCNIVLWGSASGSWNTEIHADLTATNAPAKAEIYADGILVDSYQHTSGSILADKLDAYMNLDCVYKVAKVNSTYYASIADAFAAAQDGDVITLLADVEVSDVILVNKSVTINGNGHSITSSANRVIRLTASNIEVIVNDLNMVNTKASSYIADIRGISIDAGLSNVKLTLNNSSVDFTDATAIDWSYAVNVSGNGTGHTVTINGGTYEGANVVNAHGANNTIIVKNATLTSLYPNNDLYAGACIWVLQNQNSSVEATNNTFNGANALAFNLGTGTVLNESNNTDNTTFVVAKIGSTYYVSLADAFAAGGNVTLLTDIALSESVAVNGTVVLDLNGHVITGTDNTTKNFGLINNNGTLTVKDSVGTGKITLTATVNSGWGRYSAVISNNPGGTLVVESGVIEHLGGTDMAYGIDSLTNGNNGDVSVTINGGTIKSTYRAIRQFLNSTTAKNDLVINGGTVEGANNGVFFHDPSTKANLGSITIGENADVSGVYLFVTEGSTEWPVTVSINKDAVDGNVTSKNVPASYAVVESNGVYGIDVLDVKINDTYYATIADAIAAAQAGDVLVLQDNVEYNNVLSIMKDVVIDLNGFELKSAGVAIFANQAGIVDNGATKGLLAVPKGFLIVGKSADSMLPVWNEAETGYVFVEVAAKNQITAIDEDSFKIIFRPEFDSAANAADFFKDGSVDNGINISIQINCIKGGEVVTLGFSAPQSNIQSIYSNNKAMSLTVNGAGSNFESYEVVIVLTSDTGLVYSYVAGSFANGVYTPAN